MLFALPFPRRRLQFGLGSLLLAMTAVALVLGWFAWQANTVHTRRVLAEDITARGGSVYTYGELQPASSLPQHSLSSFRRWLGDRAVGTIYLPPPQFSEDDFRTIKRRFPEAYIYPATPVVIK